MPLRMDGGLTALRLPPAVRAAPAGAAPSAGVGVGGCAGEPAIAAAAAGGGVAAAGAVAAGAAWAHMCGQGSLSEGGVPQAACRRVRPQGFCENLVLTFDPFRVLIVGLSYTFLFTWPQYIAPNVWTLRVQKVLIPQWHAIVLTF